MKKNTTTKNKQAIITSSLEQFENSFGKSSKQRQNQYPEHPPPPTPPGQYRHIDKKWHGFKLGYIKHIHCMLTSIN